MRTTTERLGLWNAFVEGGSGTFMFHVSFPLPELGKTLPPAPPLWPDRAKERIERRWAEYEIMCRKAALVDNDRVPYLSNVTGTEIYAEAFGCNVHFYGRGVAQMPGGWSPAGPADTWPSQVPEGVRVVFGAPAEDAASAAALAARLRELRAGRNRGRAAARN